MHTFLVLDVGNDLTLICAGNLWQKGDAPGDEQAGHGLTGLMLAKNPGFLIQSLPYPSAGFWGERKELCAPLEM